MTIRPVPIALVLLLCTLSGCVTPNERLSFPAAPCLVTPTERRYDTDGDGRADFSLIAGPGDGGRLRTLGYDDDQDGVADRLYHLSDYDPAEVPHVIVLFDSIPYQPVADRSSAAGWSWFDPPVKVIPPFPTMSPVIYSRMIGAPPLPGCINQYYDRSAGERINRLFERTTGDANAWERRLDYRLRYWENGLAFVEPRRWLRVDLARAREAVDASPDRVTIVYLASTACMVSKYGREGLEECLDGLEQFSLDLLHDRRGAVNISVLADHGHNLSPGVRIDVPGMLREAGFTPGDRLDAEDPGAVVVEQDGLVNYCGVHTRRAADVAAALAARPEIELAVYVAGDRVIVRGADGQAAIEREPAGGRYRYVPICGDVLGYAGVVDRLRSTGAADADGFASPRAWFDATIDHRWPDAPTRLWEAFHVVAVNIPDVMVTTRRGYYIGLPSLDWWIDMESTHGGLDQDDSATFLLTTTGRATRPMRTEEVIKVIEPRYDPGRLKR